jgi:flagellar basal-body rod protein FlgF
MASGIYVAMGAARMQEQRMETLSNNLANAQTAGFKKHGAIYRQVHNDASKMGDPNQAMDMHHPVRFLPEDRLPGQLDERFTHWSDGALRSTGNPLDVAIQGEGFFVVQGPNGDPIYTRNGTFRIQPDGGLVNQQGFALLDPNGQPVRVPPDEGALTISPEGDLTVGDQAVGRLAVVRFADLRQLDRMGNDNFRPADPAVLPEPLDLPQLHQGYLEGANVNPVQTMTQLIKTSRLFEMSTRALQAYKAMDDAAARQVGRTN